MSLAGSKRSLVALLAGLVTTVAVVVAVTSSDYLATHDGPHHLFQGYLGNHFDDPGTPYRRYFIPGQPITSLGFVLPFELLEPWLGWRAAFAVTLSLIVSIWGWSFQGLVVAVQPERRWLGLLGFSCALGWSLFMGFFAYSFSIGLSFAVVALAIRLAPWRWSAVAGLTLALTLQAIVHVFGALGSGLALTALVLAGAAGPRRRAVLQLVVMGLPVLGMVAMLAGAPTHQTDATWLDLSDRFVLLGRFGIGGPPWRTLPVLILAGLGLAWAVAAHRGRLGSLTPAERGLAGAAGAAWLLALATPLHLASWQFFSPRFVPLAMMWSLPLLPIERLGRRPIAPIAISIFSGAAILWAGWFNRSVRERIAPALAGLDHPARELGPRLTIVLDPFAGLAGGWGTEAHHWQGVALPFYAPLFNLGPLYAVGRGGVPAHVFSNNPLLLSFVKSEDGMKRLPAVFTLDSLRSPEVLATPALRRELITWLASIGRGYDEVLLYGSAEDVAVFRARGYVPTVEVAPDRLLLAALEPCRLSLEIEPPAGTNDDLLLEVAHGDTVVVRRRLTAAEVGRPVDLSNLLCGPSWVRVLRDRDRSGTPSPPDLPCEGADAQGKIAFASTPDSELRCRLADPRP